MIRTATRRTASIILFTLVFSTTAVVSAVGPGMQAHAAGAAGTPALVPAPLA